MNEFSLSVLMDSRVAASLGLQRKRRSHFTWRTEQCCLSWFGNVKNTKWNLRLHPLRLTSTYTMWPLSRRRGRGLHRAGLWRCLSYRPELWLVSLQRLSAFQPFLSLSLYLRQGRGRERTTVSERTSRHVSLNLAPDGWRTFNIQSVVFNTTWGRRTGSETAEEGRRCRNASEWHARWPREQVAGEGENMVRVEKEVSQQEVQR